MKYIEYGKNCLDTIILLHGGGLSWWNYEDVANAASIIIVHNHPGQDPTPSQTDKEFTLMMSNIGEMLGIRVDDYIIISGGDSDNYYSFTNERLLKKEI